MTPNDTALDLLLAECESLDKAATKGPWKFYHPSEHPKDWRISLARKQSHPEERAYIGRLTTSHDPKISGDGGCGLQPPAREDVKLMTFARDALPRLVAIVKALRSNVTRAKALAEAERIAGGGPQ